MAYKKIINRIADKWPAKVLSVVTAIFLFAFHRMGDLQERYFSVPIHLYLHENMIPASTFPQNVRITLRGDNNIFRIAEADIEAHLDLGSFSEPGLYRAQVQIQRRGSASEIEILEIAIDPADISIELDTKMTKLVSISPRFQGQPQQGFEMISFILEPNQLMIDGPAGEILEVFELSTDYINIHNRNNDFSIRVRVVNDNQFLTIRGEQTVEFQGFIREQIMYRNFESLPISIRGLDDNLEAVLNPPLASLRIQGLQNELDIINDTMVILSVDLSEISGPGIYRLPLAVETMEAAANISLEPEIILVEVRHKDNN